MTDNVTLQKIYGGSLRYAQDGFQFGAAHQVANADNLENNDHTISATIIGAFYNTKKVMLGGNYTVGKNNQSEFGAENPAKGRLVDSTGIEFIGHYRFSDSLKVFAGYNRLETDSKNYRTEFASVGLMSNLDKKFALYSEFRTDINSTKNGLFYGDAISVGLIYFFSEYPNYF